MDTNTIIAAGASSIGVGSLFMVFMKVYLKSTMEKIDKIPELVFSEKIASKKLDKMEEKFAALNGFNNKIQNINDRLVEIKVRLEKIDQYREQQVMLAASSKAQWKKIEKIEVELKELAMQ